MNALDPVLDYGVYTEAVLLELSVANRHSRRFRAAGLLLATAIAVVSLGSAYGTLMAAVARSPHACCEQEQAVTSCYTLCAAARSETSLGAVSTWQPPALAPTFRADLRLPIPRDAEPLAPPQPTGSSPPIYVRHAALLI